MKKEVVAHKDPKSPISEIFRTLRTNIQFINTNKKTKTLLITSTLPGEGKSWIASNLSVTFAQTGKKVILVDADMRKGRQYAIFEAPPAPGLSNYLSQIGITKKQNKSDEIISCIQKTEVPTLYLMPAGTIPPNPSELLVSPQMIKLLEKLKQAFDIVIIDATPCELVTDAVILSRIVDSTVIVTAYKVTKKDALERVIKSIQNVGGNLTGVVVNKMPISGKKYKKRYYYYGESSDLDKKEPEEKASNKIAKTTTVSKTEEVKPRREEAMKEEKTKEEKPKEEDKEKETESKTKKTTKVKEEQIKTTKGKKTVTTSKSTNQKTMNVENETKEELKGKKASTTKSSKPEKEELQKNKTENILKKMNEYLEQSNAKKDKEKGEEND